LLVFRLKVFDQVLTLNADLAEEWSAGEMSCIKSAVLFPACRQAGFGSFLLHEQKKRRKKKRMEPAAMIHTRKLSQIPDLHST
jgi:hypothetical protein